MSRSDDGSLAFKAPALWREKSWSVDDRYEGLIFDRTLRGENAASRVLGVGHQLMNLAVQEARKLPVRLALLHGLDAPLLVASVEDEVTGTGGTVHRLIFGLRQMGETATVLQDWELLTVLNELTSRRALTSLGVSNSGLARAAREASDKLLTALRSTLPRTTAIFVHPTARAEMLLMPATIARD